MAIVRIMSVMTVDSDSTKPSAPEGRLCYAQDTDKLYYRTQDSWVEVGMSAHALGGAFHSEDTLANLNYKVSDADLVALAGQLGGSAASPDVRGLRETAGPTLLALGAVADNQYLKRSGATVVGATLAGGGGVAKESHITFIAASAEVTF